jgi:hypothetical protein
MRPRADGGIVEQEAYRSSVHGEIGDTQGIREEARGAPPQWRHR